jgi:RNA polymerase sigma-70 factor (ECF subfamily)
MPQHNAPKPQAAGRGISYAQLVSMSDEGLMGQLQNGNQDALAALFERYHRLVTKVALRILRDAGEAEDLTQSVFLEIFRLASQYDPVRGPAKIWIFERVYCRGFSRRRYLNLRGIYLDLEESREEPPTSNGRSLDALESARAIKQALGFLSKAQRIAVELAYYEGLTMNEIAERTGESFGNVRHNYYRALKKLRSVLCAVPSARPESTNTEEPIPDAQS